MTNYGFDPDDVHENMHMRRRERRYNGHKLAVAVGHNKKLRMAKNNGLTINKAAKS